MPSLSTLPVVVAALFGPPLLACGDDIADDGDSTGAATGGSLDPLSMPSEPTLTPSDFNSARDCEQCHPDHVAEWELSRHAYAMTDPVFRALVEIRQSDLDGVEDQFCTSCHSSICTRGGECIPGFSFESLSPIALEGITCEACHKVQEVVRPYNSGHLIDGTAALGGNIKDPTRNAYHESKYDALFDSSEFCAGCHDVLETNGLNLERPYAEWLESAAPAAGKTCQSCHMPTYEGVAALGAPTRTDLHRHRFLGVELPRIPEILSDPALAATLNAEIDTLLQTAASMALTVPEQVTAGRQLDLVITVRNEIGAHAFPTGSTNLRQVWIEVTATNGEGTVLYETGKLDANGDLGNVWSTIEPHSDPDLLLLSSTLIDAVGQPTLYSWNASEHRTGSISPGHDRTFTLFVPVPEGTTGEIQIEAVVHFRTYPPHLIAKLGLTDTMGDALVVRDVTTASATVQVVASGAMHEE
ncbi:MAG: hypothetical protein JKY37_00820 [Nannocystaceae bacterium]|nr:hypothetical protein [Nannocystaceae bacterium]